MPNSRLASIGALVATLAVAATAPRALATDPVDTTFTYQGRLTLSGTPVDGAVNLVFRLFDQASDGVPIGVLSAPGFVITDDGRFTIDLDFGDQFAGSGGTTSGRWLEVAVNGQSLSPRQPIMATPYALVAKTAAFVPGKAMIGTYGGITGVGTLGELNVAGPVGVGTTSPQALLHIDGTGSTEVGLLIERPGSSTGRVNIGSPAGAIGISTWADNGNRRDIRFTETGMGFMVGTTSGIPSSTNGLFITEAGRIGIGTTEPTSPIHLVAPQGVLRMNTATSANGSTIVLHTDAASPTLFGAINFQAAPSGTPGQIGYRATHDMTFRVNSVERMRIDETGNLGVGTTSPSARVHAFSSGAPAVRGESVSASGVTGVGLFGVAGTAASSNNGYGGSFSGAGFLGAGRSLIAWGESHLLGNVGVGTLTPEAPLHVGTGTDVSLGSGGYAVFGATNSTNIGIDNNEIMARNNGALATLHLNADGGNVRIGQNNPTNRLITPILEITGGSDLSERFDVASLDDAPPIPGMVVCIDPVNPGKLVLSTRAYDRTVAGVISGAGGIRTGMIMGQHGSEADGAHPVALTGRVYAMAIAIDDAIEPGDLLTTSDTPGHAMRAADGTRAAGAIIGKAMTGLASGESGLVLVLVSLH